MNDARESLIAARKLREWMDDSHKRDGFVFCCETAEENGLTYAAIVALLDVLDAAAWVEDAHFLSEDGPFAALHSALARFSETP